MVNLDASMPWEGTTETGPPSWQIAPALDGRQNSSLEVRAPQRRADDPHALDLNAWLIEVTSRHPCVRSREAARKADRGVVRDILGEVSAEVLNHLLPDIRQLVRIRTGVEDPEREGQVIIRVWRVLKTTNIADQPLLRWAETLDASEPKRIIDYVMAIVKDKL